MAKRKVNKSQAIRDMFEELGPDARGKDVVAALKQKRIAVSPAQVSNIKQTLGKKKGRGRPRKSGLDVDTLLDAKQFAEKVGGVEQASLALQTLAKLQ